MRLSNLGTIVNYKKTEGINDQSIQDSFRKWTGMPKTTRGEKMPSLTGNQAFIVTEHRKKTTMYPVDEKYTSLDSALSCIE